MTPATDALLVGTCVWVAALTIEARSDDMQRWLGAQGGGSLGISDWVATGFAVVAMGRLAMGIALRLYVELAEARDDKTRARLIAEAFGELEARLELARSVDTQGPSAPHWPTVAQGDRAGHGSGAEGDQTD